MYVFEYNYRANKCTKYVCRWVQLYVSAYTICNINLCYWQCSLQECLILNKVLRHIKPFKYWNWYGDSKKESKKSAFSTLCSRIGREAIMEMVCCECGTIEVYVPPKGVISQVALARHKVNAFLMSGWFWKCEKCKQIFI